jgi:hypothetical protein
LLLLTIIRPLNRRGLALFFFLIKRTKNQVSREASLRSPALGPLLGHSPCKAVRTTGCNYFALLRSRFPMLLQKFAMPLQPHGPSLFCPLSPEAFLLTEGRKDAGN